MGALCSQQTLTVGVVSSPIAGCNGKRKRLTVYPISATPVYLNPTGPAVVGSGPVVQLGTRPVILEGDCSNQGCQAICAAGNVNVYVVDEFCSCELDQQIVGYV